MQNEIRGTHEKIEAGIPNQNAHIERLFRSYRGGVLETWLFRALDEVRELTWVLMLEYNVGSDHDGLLRADARRSPRTG